jgi:hypothetical protein
MWQRSDMIEAAGVVPGFVYTHFGEGDYAETEATIQRLLAE